MLNPQHVENKQGIPWFPGRKTEKHNKKANKFKRTSSKSYFAKYIDIIAYLPTYCFENNFKNQKEII